MNRPTGIAVIGWLAIIGGGIAILGALVSLFGGLALLAFGGGHAIGAVGGALVLMFALWLALLGAADVVFGIGTLRLRVWAWTLGVVLMIVSAVSNLVQLIAVRGSEFGDLVGLAINMVILYYLFTADVKAAFGKSNVGPTMAPVGGPGTSAPPAAYAPPVASTPAPPTPPADEPPAPPVVPPVAPPAPPVAPVPPDEMPQGKPGEGDSDTPA